VRTLSRELGALRSLEWSALGPFSGLRLEGCPLDDPLPRLIAPGQPAATRNVLAWLRGELDANSLPPVNIDLAARENEPPDLPPRSAGRHVVIDQNGRLLPAPPGSLDEAGNLLPRLRAVHPALREAAWELVAALDAGNRPHPRLLQRAQAYAALVDVDLPQVDFPGLFAVGVQLDNAARRARKAIADGHIDTPELPLAAEEALDTILEVHPGFIAASRDGSEMLADQLTIQLTAQNVLDLAGAAISFAGDLARRPDLAAPELPAAIANAAAEIATSPNAHRDATTTIAMTRDAVIGMAQCGVTGVLVAGAGGLAAITVGGLVLPVAVTGAAGVAGWESVKKTRHFEQFRAYLTFRQEELGERGAELFLRGLRGHRDLMLSAEPALRRLSTVPGFAWLEKTLDWVKGRRNDPGPE
jgi:hypothetical protein